MYEPLSIEMIEAEKAIASTLRKNRKALETLKGKPSVRASQIERIAKQIRVLETSLWLLTETEEAQTLTHQEDLAEVQAVLPSFIRRIEAVLPKFAVGSSQLTLANRRIEAFRLILNMCENLKPE